LELARRHAADPPNHVHRRRSSANDPAATAPEVSENITPESRRDTQRKGEHGPRPANKPEKARPDNRGPYRKRVPGDTRKHVSGDTMGLK